MMVFANVSKDAGARQEADRVFCGQYRLPLERFERWALVGDAESVASDLAELRNAGVDGFVLVPAAPNPLAQHDRFADVVDLLENARRGGAA
ncbi:hypothetical protein HFP15_41045 [Amycolatopsis sp. K13G38]|uniref:LLM class flavin-dependent oxidoreductase n=1 Tax=Amycolatopsis acididurans TaxID=2724524 RepID=A0ABX1JL56_9PSEU|nr:hypothetical protein [Amycolatopsis acididurans]NKQ59245.1 hypothetical protein [Amycolatopsis acididurans]